MTNINTTITTTVDNRRNMEKIIDTDISPFQKNYKENWTEEENSKGFKNGRARQDGARCIRDSSDSESPSPSPTPSFSPSLTPSFSPSHTPSYTPSHSDNSFSSSPPQSDDQSPLRHSNSPSFSDSYSYSSNEDYLDSDEIEYYAENYRDDSSEDIPADFDRRDEAERQNDSEVYSLERGELTERRKEENTSQEIKGGISSHKMSNFKRLRDVFKTKYPKYKQ